MRRRSGLRLTSRTVQVSPVGSFTAAQTKLRLALDSQATRFRPRTTENMRNNSADSVRSYGGSEETMLWKTSCSGQTFWDVRHNNGHRQVSSTSLFKKSNRRLPWITAKSDGENDTLPSLGATFHSSTTKPMPG